MSPLPPPRRPTPPAASAPAPQRAPATPPANPPAAEVETDDFMYTGAVAAQKVAEDIERQQRPRLFEFYITKAEFNAAAMGPNAKTPGYCAVPVHFGFNYVDPASIIIIPRVTIPGSQPGRFDSFTSKSGDCAIAAAGVQPQLKPIFIVCDHRVTESKGKRYQDQWRMWFPNSNMLAILTGAIAKLADNLGIQPAQVDIRKFPATITKYGTGRGSNWGIDFSVRAAPISAEAATALQEMFKEGYKQTLRTLVAPDPRFMISKGGTYVKPAKPAGGPAGSLDNEEPPY